MLVPPLPLPTFTHDNGSAAAAGLVAEHYDTFQYMDEVMQTATTGVADVRMSLNVSVCGRV